MLLEILFWIGFLSYPFGMCFCIGYFSSKDKMPNITRLVVTFTPFINIAFILWVNRKYVSKSKKCLLQKLFEI